MKDTTPKTQRGKGCGEEEDCGRGKEEVALRNLKGGEEIENKKHTVTARKRLWWGRDSGRRKEGASTGKQKSGEGGGWEKEETLAGGRGSGKGLKKRLWHGMN